MNKLLQEIQGLTDAGLLDEALSKTEDALTKESTNADLYFERGKIWMKKEEWGSAINEFNRSLEYDSSHEAAKNHIQMVRSILGFFNPDLYNP